MDETPRRSIAEMSAVLNAIAPGGHLSDANISVWMHEIRRARGGAPMRRHVKTRDPGSMPAVALEVADGTERRRLRKPDVAPTVAPVVPVVPVLPAPVLPAPVVPESLPRRFTPSIPAIPAPLMPSAGRGAPLVPVRADETYLRDWAAQRGMPQRGPLDLAAINRKAIGLGLPPFADPRVRGPHSNSLNRTRHERG